MKVIKSGTSFLSKKQESGTQGKKQLFPPESGSVDTCGNGIAICCHLKEYHNNYIYWIISIIYKYISIIYKYISINI